MPPKKRYMCSECHQHKARLYCSCKRMLCDKEVEGVKCYSICSMSGCSERTCRKCCEKIDQLCECVVCARCFQRSQRVSSPVERHEAFECTYCKAVYCSNATQYVDKVRKDKPEARISMLCSECKRHRVCFDCVPLYTESGLVLCARCVRKRLPSDDEAEDDEDDDQSDSSFIVSDDDEE